MIRSMEEVKCNYCKSDEATPLFAKKDKFSISKDDFTVVRCNNCGLKYINPRPSEEDIADFYPETYSWKETLEANSKITAFIRKLEKTYRYHLLRFEAKKVIEQSGKTSGKLLDVGCGAGDRLDIFRKIGFETYGVEISKSAEYAQRHMDLNVKQGDLFEANYPDSFFDVITLYNVLEHTHNPQESSTPIQALQ